MDIISAIGSLAKLAERVIAVERLVAELRRIMNDLGEQQFNNALVALDDARISSEPRHELTNAINHLQDAVSLSRQAYPKTDYSLRQKMLRGAWEPDNNPRYEVGKRICYALAIITAIYAAIGERELALKYAGELRNDADKAYPSGFHIEAYIRDWIPPGMRRYVAKYPPPRNAPPPDQDHDLGYWFSVAGQNLEEAFSFFESVNVLLTQVGASPFNPQLKVRVRHIVEYIPRIRGEDITRYRSWEFMVSSRRDLIMQYRRALPRG